MLIKNKFLIYDKNNFDYQIIKECKPSISETATLEVLVTNILNRIKIYEQEDENFYIKQDECIIHCEKEFLSYFTIGDNLLFERQSYYLFLNTEMWENDKNDLLYGRPINKQQNFRWTKLETFYASFASFIMDNAQSSYNLFKVLCGCYIYMNQRKKEKFCNKRKSTKGYVINERIKKKKKIEKK